MGENDVIFRFLSGYFYVSFSPCIEFKTALFSEVPGKKNKDFTLKNGYKRIP
jgi:hypothetical protein